MEPNLCIEQQRSTQWNVLEFLLSRMLMLMPMTFKAGQVSTLPHYSIIVMWLDFSSRMGRGNFVAQVAQNVEIWVKLYRNRRLQQKNCEGRKKKNKRKSKKRHLSNSTFMRSFKSTAKNWEVPTSPKKRIRNIDVRLKRLEKNTKL